MMRYQTTHDEYVYQIDADNYGHSDVDPDVDPDGHSVADTAGNGYTDTNAHSASD